MSNGRAHADYEEVCTKRKKIEEKPDKTNKDVTRPSNTMKKHKEEITTPDGHGTESPAKPETSRIIRQTRSSSEPPTNRTPAKTETKRKKRHYSGAKKLIRYPSKSPNVQKSAKSETSSTIRQSGERKRMRSESPPQRKRAKHMKTAERMFPEDEEIEV